MEKRHRIFVAINLPEDIKKKLFSYSEKWSRQSRGSSMTESSGPDLPAKWTSKDNLHITLEFLGNLTDEEIGEVCVAVKEVVGEHESFSLSLNQILYGPPTPLSGVKGTLSVPKFIWALGEKSKELAELRDDLEEVLTQKVAFAPENRIFAPHITLARISAWGWRAIEPEERPEINENIDLIFTVESIDVMESEMKKGGPQYTIIESHQLKI